MKKIFLLTIVGVGLALNACKKDKEPVDTSTPGKTAPVMTMQVLMTNDLGESIDLNKVYLSSTGDSVTFQQMRYWLSNVELVGEDNSVWKEVHSYRLMDHSALSYRDKFTLKDVPAGRYKSIRFSIGVDAARNSSIDSIVGELDVTAGMNWNWNTGYVFFSGEGDYYNSDTKKYTTWQYHIGTDANYKTITINFPQVVELAENKQADVLMSCRLTGLFSQPNVMDLKTNAILMMGPANLTLQAAENFSSLFSVDEVKIK